MSHNPFDISSNSAQLALVSEEITFRIMQDKPFTDLILMANQVGVEVNFKPTMDPCAAGLFVIRLEVKKFINSPIDTQIMTKSIMIRPEIIGQVAV